MFKRVGSPLELRPKDAASGAGAQPEAELKEAAPSFQQLSVQCGKVNDILFEAYPASVRMFGPRAIGWRQTKMSGPRASRMAFVALAVWLQRLSTTQRFSAPSVPVPLLSSFHLLQPNTWTYDYILHQLFIAAPLQPLLARTAVKKESSTRCRVKPVELVDVFVR